MSGRDDRLLGFLDLCRFRVSDILLVSSLYDSFILAEEGHVGERMASEFLDLNLRPPPATTRVATGREAVRLVSSDSRFNLVIASPSVGDMRAPALAAQLREVRPDLAFVVLAYDAREAAALASARSATVIDHVFLWQGDVRLLPAIVRLVEDRVNVGHDSGVMGVQVVLLIEDGVRFSSSFLPVIYTELMAHAAHLVPDSDANIHLLNGGSVLPNTYHVSAAPEGDRVAAIVAAFQKSAVGQQLIAESPGEGNDDIAAAARAHLAKEGAKQFDFAEQQELITEGQNDGRRARNLTSLKIKGTHYELLEAAFQGEPDSTDLFI